MQKLRSPEDYQAVLNGGLMTLPLGLPFRADVVGFGDICVCMAELEDHEDLEQLGMEAYDLEWLPVAAGSSRVHVLVEEPRSFRAVRFRCEGGNLAVRVHERGENRHIERVDAPSFFQYIPPLQATPEMRILQAILHEQLAEKAEREQARQKRQAQRIQRKLDMAESGGFPQDEDLEDDEDEDELNLPPLEPDAPTTKKEPAKAEPKKAEPDAAA